MSQKIVVCCSRDWRFKGQVLPIYVWRFENGINAKSDEPNKMSYCGIIPLVRDTVCCHNQLIVICTTHVECLLIKILFVRLI